jgi:hypothetical protein
MTSAPYASTAKWGCALTKTTRMPGDDTRKARATASLSVPGMEIWQKQAAGRNAAHA